MNLSQLSEDDVFAPSVHLNGRAASFSSRVSQLYSSTAFSNNLFASPLGPVVIGKEERFIPRFINITPKSVEESLRVAVYAGHDHRDTKSTEAVLHLVEVLQANPDIGDGLNLTLFPLVDLGGLYGAPGRRDLQDESWLKSSIPEIEALARDARYRAHHLIVELVTSAPGEGDDLLTVTLFGLGSHEFDSYADEFLSSDDFAPFSVRFEVDSSPSVSGPLTLSDDLPFVPILLRLALPANWGLSEYRDAVAQIARTLIFRYRSHQSFGQHI